MSWHSSSGPSRTRWALLLAVLVGALLRFYQLGSYPPGLYRDEAFNGLDALGVLNGELAVFFTANNGREPAYIYLTALFISLLGRTPLAVRLGAALVGSLTTVVSYRLGKSWFNERVGLYSAWLWAITLWPVHLSRIGLRPILLPLMLGLTFWLGTKAYRERSARLWLLAGLVYGLSFYTYLAVRLTPLILLLILAFLWWQKRPLPTRTHLTAFTTGTVTALLPFLLWLGQNPDQLLGRTGQVSVFNDTINGGNLLGALWGQTWRGLGLFIWQGDTILRHNPAGRPVFDWVMAIPFLIGVGVCLWRWKRPSYTTLLLWISVMLLSTILAEDTPHFLRAVGILPATIILPALGLHQIEQTTKNHAITPSLHHYLAPSLLALSLIITITNYTQYSRDPDVALLFEAAALELGQAIRAEDEETAVYLDKWFWDDEQGGWPSIPFVTNLDNVTLYRPEFGAPPPQPNQPVAIYGWQFGSLDFVPTLIAPPAQVNIRSGTLARGDLEQNAYPLYVRYATQPLPVEPPLATFGEQFVLHNAELVQNGEVVQVMLYWSVKTAVSQPNTIFVHLDLPNGERVQSDQPIAGGLWQDGWWRDRLVVQDTHTLTLPPAISTDEGSFAIGIYDPQTGVRQLVYNESGEQIGDALRFTWSDLEK